ncbi:YiiX family permuted papain-like enzyme [Rufibacter roseus]|uniref:YiiX family permuted papain-like enzyme n=1 Tax=Rufibacter roseus TaxID=1567108 RepID=A0ABW2DIH9_9BACT|nr:YiiX family permuted papain-like enzyme [Rufibacter roseus]
MLKSKLLLLIFLLFVISAVFLYKKHFTAAHAEPAAAMDLESTAKLQNGDLIFHTSTSAQSKAIQLATKSKYSHCGIIYQNGGDYFVFEAVQPVSVTPLAKWIARGKGGHFVVKRLKNAHGVLTPAVLSKMKAVGEGFKGKDYDLTFEWSDDKIYCSELIWKVYQRATGLEIGKLEQLKDFDLNAGPVQQKMKERYGSNIPYQEQVISPASVFASDLLVTVMEK